MSGVESVPAKKLDEAKKDDATKDSSDRKSPDIGSRSGPPSESHGSNSKFNLTGMQGMGPGVYAKMLMTGMSSLGVDGA